MGNAFRLQPGPALYPPNATPFLNDVEEVGIGVAFCIIAFSFILIIPGIRGWEVRQHLENLFAAYIKHVFPLAASLFYHSSLCCPLDWMFYPCLQLWLHLAHC